MAERSFSDIVSSLRDLLKALTGEDPAPIAHKGSFLRQVELYWPDDDEDTPTIINEDREALLRLSDLNFVASDDGEDMPPYYLANVLADKCRQLTSSMAEALKTWVPVLQMIPDDLSGKAVKAEEDDSAK